MKKPVAETSMEAYWKILGQLRARCETVASEFRAKMIDLKEVYRRLGELETWAYAQVPDAEPDGDITYTVATARDRIDEYAKQNQNQQRHTHRGNPKVARQSTLRNKQACGRSP